MIEPIQIVNTITDPHEFISLAYAGNHRLYIDDYSVYFFNHTGYNEGYINKYVIYNGAITEEDVRIHNQVIDQDDTALFEHQDENQ